MRYWLECCDRAAVPVGERHQKESIWEEKLAACVWRHVEGLLSSGALRAALDERGRRARRTVDALRSQPAETQVLFLSRLFARVEVHRGHLLLVYQMDLLPPVELDTTWRFRGYESVPW